MPEKKTLKQTIRDYRHKHSLNISDFVRQAGVHFSTVSKAEKGEYDKNFSTAKGQKKVGVARAIVSLARACGEQPTQFLEAAGIPDILPEYGPMTREKSGAVFSMPIGKEDLDYLSTVLAGLQQPLTLGLVVELLQRRQQVSPG